MSMTSHSSRLLSSTSPVAGRGVSARCEEQISGERPSAPAEKPATGRRESSCSWRRRMRLLVMLVDDFADIAAAGVGAGWAGGGGSVDKGRGQEPFGWPPHRPRSAFLYPTRQLTFTSTTLYLSRYLRVLQGSWSMTTVSPVAGWRLGRRDSVSHILTRPPARARLQNILQDPFYFSLNWPAGLPRDGRVHQSRATLPSPPL